MHVQRTFFGVILTALLLELCSCCSQTSVAVFQTPTWEILGNTVSGILQGECVIGPTEVVHECFQSVLFWT